jgi:hypothetical protein
MILIELEEVDVEVWKWKVEMEKLRLWLNAHPRSYYSYVCTPKDLSSSDVELPPAIFATQPNFPPFLIESQWHGCDTIVPVPHTPTSLSAKGAMDGTIEAY